MDFIDRIVNFNNKNGEIISNLIIPLPIRAFSNFLFSPDFTKKNYYTLLGKVKNLDKYIKSLLHNLSKEKFYNERRDKNYSDRLNSIKYEYDLNLKYLKLELNKIKLKYDLDLRSITLKLNKTKLELKNTKAKLAGYVNKTLRIPNNNYPNLNNNINKILLYLLSNITDQDFNNNNNINEQL